MIPDHDNGEFHNPVGSQTPSMRHKSYCRLARICAVAAILIGIAGMLGWILRIPVLTSIVPTYKPIAISAAILFVLLGGVQWLACPLRHRGLGILLLCITLFVTLFGLSEFIFLVTGIDVTIEDAILRQFPTLEKIRDIHIAPVAGILLFFIGLAQSLFLYQYVSRRPTRALIHLTGLLGSLVILISAVFFLGYLYGVPFLAGIAYLQIAWPATIAALFSGIGIVAAIGDAAAPLCWFAGASMQARLSRAFLPITVLILLLSQMVQYLLVEMRWLHPAIIALLLTLLSAVVIGMIIQRVARATGSVIERAEKERERLLDEVRQRAAESAAIITSIADGLVVNDLEGCIVTANPAAQHILNMPPERWRIPFERWMGRHLYLPDGGEMPLEDFPALRAMQGTVVRSQVLRIQFPRRADVWLSVSAAPIRMPDGPVLGAVTILTDVTELHKLQEQERLLLHTVAHDLRAPATIINGQLGLLLELLGPQATSGPVQYSVAALQRALRRMSRMIDDLTQVTLFDAGEISLQRTQIMLATYLPDLVTRNTEVIDPARMILDIPQTLPPVSADPDRLERIMMNLLTNAEKYSDAGTPIRISARQQDSEVVISVTDQGQGIPPDDIPHVFDRFFRSTYKRKGEGIGLGLYIVNKLVAAHGGRIWVESEVGQGSIFYFTLPVAGAKRTEGDHP